MVFSTKELLKLQDDVPPLNISFHPTPWCEPKTYQANRLDSKNIKISFCYTVFILFDIKLFLFLLVADAESEAMKGLAC